MRKIPFAGIELTSQRVRGYMLPLSYRGDRSGKGKACVVCDHGGLERSDLGAEIVIIIIIISVNSTVVVKAFSTLYSGV